MMGGFDLMAAMLVNQLKVQATFKSGTGVALSDQAGCMFGAVARFFQPGYDNNARSLTSARSRSRCRCDLLSKPARRSSAQMTHQILHSDIL